jgi:cytoskeleton protein RodZ
MDEGEAQSHSSSPGARLAAAREQAGMTLPQAAERLRLDVATLQALEAGRFDTLGAAVFVRGHLRHYAELVGLPLDEIDAAYAASSAKLAPQPDLRRTTTLPGNSAPRRISLPPRAALIGAIVLVLVALVWWAMRVAPGPRQGAVPAGSSPTAAPAGEAPGAATGAPAVDAAQPPPVSEPTAPRTDGAASPKPAAPASKEPGARDAAAAFRDVVLGTRAQAAPVADAAAAGVSPMAPKPASPTAAATVAPKPASVRVRLAIRFNQDSWTEIYDARGATLFHDFGSAGSERRVSGLAPLRVLLGNPDGVSVELDGHPVALKAAAESGRPQRFLLDSAGRLGEVPTTQAPSTTPAAITPATTSPAAVTPSATPPAAPR